MSFSPEETVASIRSNLRQEEPATRVARDTAAVAVILANSSDSVLLIKRAERESDPWSGHVAFPGGRVESNDLSFKSTAIRETSEEVGVDLAARATFLGYMEPFHARTREILVIPCVFLLDSEVTISQDEEVFSHRWVSLSELADEKAWSTYLSVRGSVKTQFPSFVFGDYTIWGLTERILSTLLEYAMEGRMFPER